MGDPLVARDVSIGDIVNGLEAGAAAAVAPAAPPPAATPPPDLMSIISEAVAIYAAAKAGGKHWYLSRGMWGSVGTLASAVGLPALLALHAPVWAYLALSAFIAFSGAASGVGRMTAVGPIK